MSEENLKETQKKSSEELTEPTYPGKVFSPAVDIFETKEAITVIADMPGVEAGNLAVDLEKNILTLSARVPEPEQEPGTLLLQEYLVGSYYRRFSLSNQIDQEKIVASMKNGVVRIELPKVEKQIPRQIDIRTT